MTQRSLVVGPHCLLLVVLLLKTVVSQGSSDGILSQHCSRENYENMWLALNIVYILPRRVTVRLTGAVKFNRWKTELFGNVSVFNLQSFIHLKDRSGTRVISCLYIICFQSVQRFTHRFALHPLSGQRAGGNGRTTAKCFEPGIYYLPLVIHLNLSKEKLYLSHHHILKEENSIAVIQIYNLKLKKVSLLKCVIIKIIPLINTRWQ